MSDHQIFELAEARLTLGEGPLRFAEENRAAIERNWRREAEANPRLWNGPFFMFEEVAIGDGLLTGVARRTDFATMLFWRHAGRPADAVHITGTSLPVTADGALLGVRMAGHTANPGAVYFPAGSFDEADIAGNRIDVTANIAREMEEETGIAFDAAAADGGFVAVTNFGAIHVARRTRLSLDFDDCARALARHQTATGDDEIEEAVAIRAGETGPEGLKSFARALADWHFENAEFSCTRVG